MTDGAALVLFSGGQDSTTCLAWALARFAKVETLGFDYGQRHAAELAARPRILADLRERFPAWRESLGMDHVLALDILKAIGGSALTDTVRIAMGANGLPTTFVPGRNLLFLAAAAALAYRRGIVNLIGGMCETDFSGYPDCRPAYYEAFNQVIRTGTKDGGIEIVTPLIALRKHEIVRRGLELGAPFDLTWSCYSREDQACGVCDSCVLRLRAFAEAGAKDPIPYATPAVATR